MRLQRIFEAVYYQPWFITVNGYASVSGLLERALARTSDEGDFLSAFVEQRPAMAIDRDGIATIHVCGVLGQRLSQIERSCGNTGYEQITGEIAQARREGAQAFLFLFDTPGGTAVGCGETAAAIASLTEPTASYTDSIVASAGYYLAAGTDFIVSSPSAIVGSIGTILPWIDKAKMWEVRGLAYQPVVNEGASLKSVGGGPSLSDEQREFLQQHVDDLAHQFQQHVIAHRDVDDEVWRAGFYIGDRAATMGLLDDIGNEALAREWLRSQCGS